MASNIPIVEGVAVEDQRPISSYGYQQAPKTDYVTAGGGGDGPISGHVAEMQQVAGPRRYQDVFWALLFVGHLIAVMVAIAFGLSSVDLQSGPYGSVIYLVVVSGVAAVGLSTLALSFMMRNAELLVQMALIFSVLTSLAIGIVGFMTQQTFMGVVGILSFAIGICYAKLVWHRIPFAASNLNTALTAVKANMGLAVLAYFFTALAFGWTLLWFLGLGESLDSNKLPIVFLLFVSYYWVHEVLKNTMHVTTAGVIGTWWFVPDEANSCCSPALTDSAVRATTTSFGSICFGSLLVAVVQALRALEYYTRDSDDFAFLSCIIQCLLSCLQSILEELTKFAYIYVGLYGFGFIDAGRNVIQLFQQKGWTVIITDDLAENVLFMMSMAIGLATGLIGLVIGWLDSSMFEDFGLESSAGPAFLIGFLTGFVFSSVLLSVVASAINTVIVCYAEAPGEFEANHPHLSQQMRATWTQAWPGLF